MTRTGNTVAVIGLGVMGAPMAANLIDAGYDVVGFNRSPGKVETHVARGGRGASSIAAAVEGADVVLTVLPDTPDVDLAVTGGLASSRILELKAANMVARHCAPGFRVDLHHKDLGIVTAAARDAGVAIPLGATAAQLMGALRAQGNGGLDHSALHMLIETLSGRRPA